MDFKENTDRIVGDIRKGLEALGMIALLASPLDWGTKEQIMGEAMTEEPKNAHTTNGNGKLRRNLKLHGRYMGLVKPLSKANRKKVAKIRETKGYTAAIAKAKQLQA